MSEVNEQGAAPTTEPLPVRITILARAKAALIELGHDATSAENTIKHLLNRGVVLSIVQTADTDVDQVAKDVDAVDAVVKDVPGIGADVNEADKVFGEFAKEADGAAHEVTTVESATAVKM